MTRYWIIWFATSITAFVVPEVWALASGRPQDTLSETIWRMEDLVPGHLGWPWMWSGAHILFGGGFLLLAVWLTGHFLLGIWR